MASHKYPLLCFTILIALFFSNSPTTTYAEKPTPPKPTESYKVVNEFCQKRRTSEEREFCIRVLKSHPNSTSAKDYVSLLLISVDQSIGNIKKTNGYLMTLSKSKATNPSFIPVLKECISAYDGSIGQLRIIPEELKADPPTASYDALMASDEIFRCENSLNASKIVDHSVSSRHKIARAHVQLCVDISMKIH